MSCIRPINNLSGARLARAARHLVYGEPSHGFRPGAAQRDDAAADTIVVSFDGVEGALVAYSANRPIGFELCGAEQSSCRFVDATLQSNRVVLDASAIDNADARALLLG